MDFWYYKHVLVIRLNEFETKFTYYNYYTYYFVFLFILAGSQAIPSHGNCGAFDEEVIEVECPAGAIFPETTQNLNALDRPPGWPGIQIRMGSEFFREFLWLNYFDIFDILWSPGGNHGGKIVDFCFSNLAIFSRIHLENLRDLDALIIVGNLLRMTSHPPAR